MNEDGYIRTETIQIENPFTGEHLFAVTCLKRGCLYEPTTLGFCDDHFSLVEGLEQGSDK